MAELQKLGPGLLTIGETGSPQEFGAMTTKTELEPEYDKDDDVSVLSGEDYGGDETEKWTLKFDLLQDYTAESLNYWLYQNAGKTLPFTFVPNKEGALQAKGKVRIRASKLGGEVKKTNSSEMELPVIGRPDITPDYAG
ncbi:hypothetical protein [Rothia sp. L_38]|uniref:hypothetical protein n=1 Tax=Rothia sp. L_38 TaxID=3422315 RepID=UPI003D6C4F47